ncbi:glycoside hydrolase [Flavihumibacter sp. R14]|nr:glycoside hydrolase [Flavihumibacter soli]
MVKMIYATNVHGLPGAIRTVFQKNNTLKLNYSVKPWYKYREDGKPGREVILYFNDKLEDKATITIECNGGKESWDISPVKPLDSLSILLPADAGLKATQAQIVLLTSDGKYEEKIVVPAKKQWTVYIYPHSHVDIGYTNLQEVVEKLHVRNIDVGIDIARKTQHYPEGARFVWNPESTWVVSSYLKNASPEQKASFIEAVKKGWIQIDGAHSNLNTGILSDEEILQIFKNSKEIEAVTGVPVNTMVQMDNPGASWGLVQAAAQNGIHGFFSFPNYYDLRKKWENQPFYWRSQDGKSRLFFLQATSYGYGYRAKGSKYGLGKIQAFTAEYDRLSTSDPMQNFIDPFIFEETAKLERANSPYDIFAMTWSMADNCLIDADLPEAVRQWNQKYAYPKLVIAGTKDILAVYEKKYGSVVPEYTGDFTEFWTNGLGSDAKRVGMARRAKENLVQAETLWQLLHKDSPAPVKEFRDTWENLLLAAEHTWGYQDPRAPLAKEVEANKASFFENAETLSKDLIADALKPIKKEGSNTIAIINTLSWPRDGLITLSAEQSLAGDRVVDDRGKAMLSQRLSSGELVFQCSKIPPFGSGSFRILPGKNTQKSGFKTSAFSISNELISVILDEKTGSIKNLTDLKTKREFVNPSSNVQLNNYNYVVGVFNGKDIVSAPTYASEVSVKIKESGPLIVSLLVRSKAEGCNWLTREIRITKDKPFIELINTIDKIATKTKEGIHFGFDFNIPSGKTRMDIPLGVITPDENQLSGANRNWFTFQRWVDISNKDYGVTWTSIESPLIEFGNLTGNILDGARQAEKWLKTVPETQTLYSWLLNNHWDTNFPLEQGGVITSRYYVLLHGAYDPVVANRFGVEQHRPLIAVETAKTLANDPLVLVNNPRIMVSSLKRSADNQSVILRLRSVSEKAEQVALTWPLNKPVAVYQCLPDEKPLQSSSNTFTIPAYGLTSLRIDF